MVVEFRRVIHGGADTTDTVVNIKGRSRLGGANRSLKAVCITGDDSSPRGNRKEEAMLHNVSDDNDPADQRHLLAELLDRLGGCSEPTRLTLGALPETRWVDEHWPAVLYCLAADNLRLRAERAQWEEEKRRLEKQIARLTEGIETTAYTCHRQGHGEGYEQGRADAKAADPPHATDPDVPVELIYALKAPTSSWGLVDVRLVVHGTEIVATVRPGSDPSKVWASICAEVA